ncbi:MAG: fatty acid desaturase [Halioglobus sp.]|nr:fatty acid desaturase [Halioglobus sp.]
MLALTAGAYSGLGINTAHELGHKKSNFERFLARIVLAVPAYGHFCVEHNRGHHTEVATPQDPASARMGESIYKFMLREIPGAMRRGWEQERKRLALFIWSATRTTMPTRRAATRACAISTTCRSCQTTTTACTCSPTCPGCGTG